MASWPVARRDFVRMRRAHTASPSAPPGGRSWLGAAEETFATAGLDEGHAAMSGFHFMSLYGSAPYKREWGDDSMAYA